MHTAFSVLMAVYAKESPAALDAALGSLARATLAPTDVVLVKDGALTAELDAVIAGYGDRLPLKTVPLSRNVGLGPALNEGLARCTHPWVARFDADDIIVPERFALQLEYLRQHPETDIVGGYILEFDGVPPPRDAWPGSRTVRTVPLEHGTIKNYVRRRNPFNHMTVMYRRDTVTSLGGYPTTYPQFEDYALWAKMIHAGARTANIAKILVLARAGEALPDRRRGWAYAKSEIAMQRLLHAYGLATRRDILLNLMVRVPARLAPRAMLRAAYKHLLRS